MTLRRYLVLAVVTLASAFGDTSLAVGMKRLGPVSLTHPDALITALRTPWVLSGVLLLLLWTACYLTALTWADLTIVLTATAGDVLLASAMRSVGDLDEVKAAHGLHGAIWAVLSERRFLAGGAFMALSFFSLLFSLSHADVSLIAPAAGSLTFVTNAVAGKWMLHENVDRGRWLAAVFVCGGVALLKR